MPLIIGRKHLKFLGQSAAFLLSLVVVLISSVNSYILEIDQTLDSFRFTQKRALTFEDVDLVDVCTSVQSFERLDSAVNVDLVTVEIHPEAWVFATRCKMPGKSCRGIGNGIHSMCRPKKSWVQVYGRATDETWRPHWVAVDTACVCSIRRSLSKLQERMPLLGRSFLP